MDLAYDKDPTIRIDIKESEKGLAGIRSSEHVVNNKVERGRSYEIRVWGVEDHIYVSGGGGG